MRSRRVIPLWLLMAFLFGCASAQSNAMPLLKEISYSDHNEATLNVYLPAGDNQSWPVILLIHGRGVDKEYFEGTSTVDDLTQQGYAAVSINYRFPTATNPGSGLADAACALAWIYDQSSSYGFDTNRIAVMGHSTGATLAALLAVRDDIATAFLADCSYSLPDEEWIKGVIGYGGRYGTPATFSDPGFLDTFAEHSEIDPQTIQAILGQLAPIHPSEWLTSSDLPDAIRQFASFLSVAWLDGTEPPFLLVHGEVDETVSVDESITFADALREAGASVELVVIPAGYHRVDEEALHEPLFKFLSGVAAS